MSCRDTLGRLHLLTDETLQDRWTHLELARFGVRGGAEVIQYREKRSVSTPVRIGVGLQIARVAASRGARLVVNDRVDVAVACGAGGVHLGREDLHPSRARDRLGPSGLIGSTANGMEEAIRVSAFPVDYVGVGPVFGTASKAAPAPALGLDLLQRIVGAIDKPVVAIGGIGAQEVTAVLEAGAHGIAVLSAFACAADPLEAAERLAAEVRAFLASRGERAG